MHYPVPMTIPEGRWRRRAVVATALAGVVAVALVIANPSLLRRGEREPIPTGGPVDDLEVVCSDAVTAGFCSDPEPLADEMRNGELVILESHVAADGVTSPRRLRVAVDRADLRHLVVLELEAANEYLAVAQVIDLQAIERQRKAAHSLPAKISVERDDDGSSHIPVVVGLGKRRLDVVPHARRHGA